MLIGPPGVGKTHLALACYNEVKKRANGHFLCLFISEVELLARIRNTYAKEAQETEAQVLNVCKGVPLLILDDLCKYTPQDASFRNRILFEILDFRCLRRKVGLFITANQPLPSLTETLGAPIVDRLRGMCEVVEMKGQSQRGLPPAT